MQLKELVYVIMSLVIMWLIKTVDFEPTGSQNWFGHETGDFVVSIARRRAQKFSPKPFS